MPKVRKPTTLAAKIAKGGRPTVSRYAMKRVEAVYQPGDRVRLDPGTYGIIAEGFAAFGTIIEIRRRNLVINFDRIGRRIVGVDDVKTVES